MTTKEWADLLLYREDEPESDLLSRCEYLGYCINETLRIDPSVRISTPHEISDNIELGGKKIKAGQTISVHIAYLHHNPSQWVEPSEYIPERFDHKVDKYYLAPTG